MSGSVRVERDARGVATVTFDNQRRLNTLDSALMAQFVAAMQALATDLELRAVVLAGAGTRAFVGGASLDEMAGLDGHSARAFIELLHQCCAAPRRVPVPVVARLQGWTLGAGLELAASCDLRVAGQGTRLGMPEVRVGIPSVVEAVLLPKLIGFGRARWLLMTGESIDAERALAWGLVDEAVPDAELDAAVARTVDALLQAGPQAIREQKRLLQSWEDAPVEHAVAQSIDAFARAWDTDEPARMMRAALTRMRG